MRRLLAAASSLGVGLVGLPSLVLAASSVIPTPLPSPAPLLGVGLPVAGAVIGAVVIARYLRQKA